MTQPIRLCPEVLAAAGFTLAYPGSENWALDVDGLSVVLIHYDDHTDRWHYSMEGQREGIGFEYLHELRAFVNVFAGVDIAYPGADVGYRQSLGEQLVDLRWLQQQHPEKFAEAAEIAGKIISDAVEGNQPATP